MSTYLFIDGNYLRRQFERQMHAFYGCAPAIDFEVVASRLGGERVYYYDAIDYQQADDESVAQCEARVSAREALHEFIAGRPGFHVREGHVRRRASRKKPREQKAVDVQLAVDALEHAARGNIRKAVLLAGDLDFEPLLASLVRLGVRTSLCYCPQSTSPELLRAADEIHKITLEHFHAWSAPSFRQNYRAVKFEYRQSAPELPIFEAVKKGTWSNRTVRLFRPTNQAAARLYVGWGDELREPSFLLEYPQIDKLPQAFELTFGKIVWND